MCEGDDGTRKYNFVEETLDSKDTSWELTTDQHHLIISMEYILIISFFSRDGGLWCSGKSHFSSEDEVKEHQMENRW